ncbi:MAG: glycosidase, partial [Ekhidna sp.]|nr:glycosidase [Ekhidna sp.]
MNEEWFGICAKGPTSETGLYTLYPRAAYYALKEAHELDPYAPGVTAEYVDEYFDGIELFDAVLRARGDKAALSGEKGDKISVDRIRAEFTTFMTGGHLITTENPNLPSNGGTPDRLGFDRMESYFVGVEAKPDPSIRANVTFNILGNVATNPINEIFYESRGQVESFVTSNGNLATTTERLAVYQADYTWDHKYFTLDGFYRTGHYHWGYEGDFFGLYPEANYGPNIDIYNGLAPNGFEITGKKELDGLKVAYGPELWWGANPAILMKYTTNIKNVEVTGIFHEDLEEPGSAVSSLAVPQPRTRRASVYGKTEIKGLGVEVGGLWGGAPLVGREFQVVTGEAGNYQVFTDEIENSDKWGGKVKLTYQGKRINWYGQASSRGLVAQAGGDYTQTFTGWRLKDFGSGNVNNVFTGFTYNLGKVQVAPNFMYQKPLVDPIPGDAPAPARLRNILDDPFVVRSNRETVAGELLLTFDPTPGTWMYAWDNDRAEDAGFALSLGFVYWHLPTSQDAAVIFPGDGRTPVAAPGAAPAQDLWEVNARIVSKMSKEFGLVANLFGGTGQARGDDERTIERFG